MRFIEELFEPSKKCERIGHDMEEHYRSGYYDGGVFRSVATKVTQSRRVCRRCGYAEEWTTIDKQGIQTLSGPPEFMNIVRSHNSNDPYWDEYW